MTPELLRVEDFCSRYSISRPTFYRLASKGEGFPPLVKIGRSTRVRVADAQAWFDGLHGSEAA